mmetsp:Transcript_31385/g.101454  ORF Transcript_31385/g.101454 Transcript_31385/m.101454 type:complete len:201 (+) Transcript_31385:218-820(+)
MPCPALHWSDRPSHSQHTPPRSLPRSPRATRSRSCPAHRGIWPCSRCEAMGTASGERLLRRSRWARAGRGCSARSKHTWTRCASHALRRPSPRCASSSAATAPTLLSLSKPLTRRATRRGPTQRSPRSASARRSTCGYTPTVSSWLRTGTSRHTVSAWRRWGHGPRAGARRLRRQRWRAFAQPTADSPRWWHSRRRCACA